MADPPSGTVTFLFTDIEGSTARWERDRAAMREAVARQLTILQSLITAHHGVLYKTIGDGTQAAFGTAEDALRAALASQRALLAEEWGEIGPLTVRMALHTGEAAPDDRGDYLAASLNRLARLLSTGYGGQILLSQTVQQLTRGGLPAGTELRDLGEHRLRDLLEPERVYQLVHPDLPGDFPPLSSLDARPQNLPCQPTPFLGREQQVAEVADLLRRGDTQLVTLIGPGGTGKTRLALQAAAELLEDFVDGVYFVDLAPLMDPKLVPGAIAAALSVREEGGSQIHERLRDVLRPKTLLLVLDNFERLTKAGHFVSALLAACPGLHVLATSRVPLHVRAERHYPVPPLTLPESVESSDAGAIARSEAVQLFVERAQAARPDFALTPGNAPVVAEIVRRLDGLPLAIELAAARIRLLPPAALLERLERRLTLLTGGPQDAPARQRTLRDEINWSYDLLAADEQDLFRRLAAFVGGFTLAAAEAVAGRDGELDVFAGLASLVDSSLVRQADHDREPRFAMLETIREYGLEQLDAMRDAATVRRAHADFFLKLAEEAEQVLTGPEQVFWLDTLGAEHDNLRAALSTSVDGQDLDTARRLAGALYRFWRVRGHLSEGRAWLERLLPGSEDASPSVRARLLDGAGLLAAAQGDRARAEAMHGAAAPLWAGMGERSAEARSLAYLGQAADAQGDHDRAVGLHERAVALFREAGDDQGAAASLGDLGAVAYDRGDLDRAEELHQESLRLLRSLGDERGVAIGLMSLGLVALAREDHAHALALGEEAAALWRALGDDQALALTLGNVGFAVEHLGQAERAEALHGDALSLLEAVGDRQGAAWARCNLGRLAVSTGDDERAGTLLAAGLSTAQELDDLTTIAECLEGFAALASVRGPGTTATRLFGAADMLRESAGTPLQAPFRATLDRHVADARAAIGEGAFAAAWATGRALPLAGAISEALAMAKQHAHRPDRTRKAIGD
jgi:predicted ATPase/class 3 adenylate cyclase